MPFVEWREPLRIETTDGEWCLACRVCVALHGFQARSVADWPRTRQEWDEHFREHLEP